jgi:hypothetical protein
MFKKTAFKAFAPAFITLSFVISIIILVACGSSSGNGPGGGGESSSSRPPNQSVGSNFDGSIIDSISITAELYGTDEEALDIFAFVRGNREDPTDGGNWTLDSVIVKLNGKIVSRNISLPGKNYTTPRDDQIYTFVGNECCNDPSQVSVYAYAHGKKEDVGNANSKLFTRKKGVCAPSSSSIASSSSVTALAFSEISFSGGAKLGAEQGITFSGTITESPVDANIYYDGANITVKSGGKIITTFNPPRGPIYYGSDGGSSNVLNPQNTSQFIPDRSDAGVSIITQGQIAADQYFMIRTTGSSGEWTSSDYLFLITQYNSSEPSITVKAWKVN